MFDKSNTVVFVREIRRCDVAEFWQAYSANEMAEVFTYAERAALAAGEVVVRTGTIRCEYVNGNALAARAMEG